jgi:hypothetical protein
MSRLPPAGHREGLLTLTKRCGIMGLLLGLFVGFFIGTVGIYKTLRTEARSGLISFGSELYKTEKVTKVGTQTRINIMI